MLSNYNVCQKSIPRNLKGIDTAIKIEGGTGARLTEWTETGDAACSNTFKYHHVEQFDIAFSYKLWCVFTVVQAQDSERRRLVGLRFMHVPCFTGGRYFASFPINNN